MVKTTIQVETKLAENYTFTEQFGHSFFKLS